MHDEVTKPAHVRRTTIEIFNEEMAALERPLEHDIEFEDDKPASRWGRLVPAVAAIGLLVGSGYLLGMRIIGGPMPWPQVAMVRVAPAPVAAPAAAPPAVAPVAPPVVEPAAALPAAMAIASTEEAVQPAAPEKTAAAASAKSWSRLAHPARHKRAHRR